MSSEVKYIPQVEYYSVYDKVADTFAPLFGAKNDNVAYRSFSKGLEDAKDVIADDLELWHVGTLNDTIKERGFFANMYVVSGVEKE